MVGQTVEKYPMSFMYIMLGISTGKPKFCMKEREEKKTVLTGL